MSDHPARGRTALLKLSSPELAGTHEDRRELWRDRRGRRSRVVLTPPCWRQVWWRCIRLNRAWHVSDIHEATVAKVQGSPGRPRISRNPSRRESRDDPVHLWSTRALLARDRGCNRRPAFPAPSFLMEGEKLMQASGASRGENFGCVCITLSIVIVRLDRTTQYSRDADDGIDRPGRTGSPACAGGDGRWVGERERDMSRRQPHGNEFSLHSANHKPSRHQGLSASECVSCCV